MTPTSGSPAIDAGDNAACPATDYRGIARPVDGNGDGNAVCDMGAYEWWEPTQQIYLPLVMGWNLISLAVLPATLTGTSSTVITRVLSSIAGSFDAAYTYDATDPADPWKQYVVAGPPSANDLTAIELGKGYWIQASAPVTLAVSGTVPSTTTIPLVTGWNLVGYPSSTARPVEEALASIAGKYDLVLECPGLPRAGDPGDPAVPWRHHIPSAPSALPVLAVRPGNTLTELAPGRGYWVRMTQDATLTVAP
jgi:hypothetical protein